MTSGQVYDEWKRMGGVIDSTGDYIHPFLRSNCPSPLKSFLDSCPHGWEGVEAILDGEVLKRWKEYA